jgi:hypothetical protein
MSYYSDASLVMIPSGVKNGTVFSQKPLSSDGELTLTRTGDTATRVGSDGLIEKVRTNLVLQSETFSNAQWGKTASTITDNATTAPNGTTTADKLIAQIGGGGAVQHRIDQTTVSASGSNTFSVYAKKGEIEFIFLRNGLAGAWFNLNDGSVSNVGAGLVASSVNAGDGWYRLIITKTSAVANEIVRINLSTGSGLSDFIGNNTDGAFIWGAQYELNDIATPYIGPTLAAAVSVGPVANLPRLDYSGGATCGKLLLEGQRTNSLTYSEAFDNAAWGKVSATITANTTISPDGYQNADTFTTSGGGARILKTLSLGAGTYTASLYVKKLSGSGDMRFFGIVDGGGVTQSFTPTDEWQRFTGNFTATTGITEIQLRENGFTGTLAIYGFQLELGSYSTSYIPTLGAAVTRVFDGAYKTGISSLIGQTEGVAFIDFVWNGLTGTGSYPRIMELWEDSSNYLQLYTVAGSAAVYWEIKNAGVVQFSGNTSMSLGNNKIAIGYKLNDMVIYKNGSLIASDATCTVPSTSALGVAGSYTGAGAQLAASVNQTLLFPTRLTNAQLAELTTI